MLVIVVLPVGYGVMSSLKPLEINVVAVGKDTFVKTIEEVAYVSDANQYEIYSQNGGEVVSVKVKAGDTVKTGQVIMELKNPQSQSQASQIEVQVSQIQGQITAQNAAVAAAKTALDVAKKELDRSENLFKEGGIPQATLDVARQAYTVALEQHNAAKSALASLQAQKSATSNMLGVQNDISKALIVKSPRAGVVLSLDWEQGQLVAPGQLLATLGDGDKFTIKADFLADDTVAMKVGQKTMITSPILPAGGVEGKVKSINPKAEEKISALGIAQRRVGVTIEMPAGNGLKPGFEVRAAVVIDQQDNVIVIPQGFIHQEDSKDFVWIIKDGILAKQPVTITAKSSKDAVVTGIDTNMSIVTELPTGAKEGSKVVVAE